MLEIDQAGYSSSVGRIFTALGPSQIARRQLTARQRKRAVAKQRSRHGCPSIDIRRFA